MSALGSLCHFCGQSVTGLAPKGGPAKAWNFWVEGKGPWEVGTLRCERAGIIVAHEPCIPDGWKPSAEEEAAALKAWSEATP
jgi:hypothetical protein